MDIQIETQALDDMARHYQGAAPIIKDELTKAIRRLVILGQNAARKGAPVDTGRLRNSIAYEVSGNGTEIIGKFGTNVQYGKAVEYGTGLLSTAPDGKGGRHWPPGDALNGWALRHGFSVESGGSTVALGQIVAEIIGKRGGLRPKPYLKPAFDEIKPKVGGIIEAAAVKALARIAGSGR